MSKYLPPLPSSWAALTWQQLCDCWQAKLRYGGNADVARCAALLALTLGPKFQVSSFKFDELTGEQRYLVSSDMAQVSSALPSVGLPETCHLKPETYTLTPRQLAHLARKALPWFDFPYGDQGEPEEKDEQGQVTKEGREAVFGYVNPDWRDAMELPEQEVVVMGREIVPGSKFQVSSNRPETWHLKLETKGEPPVHFALPERACTNVTWHQYRALQSITQQLFQDGIADDAATELQAQFLAYILLPEQPAQTAADRFARRHTFRYDADRAEQTVPFWRSLLTGPDAPAAVLYALCFQTYQTALRYYEKVFPLLYQTSGKADPLHDALTGEVDTINCVMKYQGYSSPEQVYNTELPIVLSVLNTITKEAKEIEKMNAKIKRKG